MNNKQKFKILTIILLENDISSRKNAKNDAYLRLSRQIIFLLKAGTSNIAA